MPDIYRYTDYRAFLRDYFADQKAANPVFSHQFFARKANIKSSGFVLHVMNGERNLTRPVMLNIARAMGLDSSQTEYFEDLVAFDQARRQSDREFYLARIAVKRKNVRTKPLEDRQHEIYSAWYHPVVREAVTLSDNMNDPSTLSKFLIPQITPRQAKESLKLQQNIGVLTIDEKGKHHQAETFISGGGQVRNTLLVRYQKEMLEQAKAAWDRFSPEEMTMHTVTLCMSEDMLPIIREEIRAFKTRLFELVGSE